MKKVNSKYWFLALCPLLISSSSGPYEEPKKKKDPKEAVIMAMPQYMQDYNAGVEAQKQKDYATAIEYYRKAIDQKEDLSDAWNNMAFSYRMIAKAYLDKSGEAYDMALKYNPQHEKALEYQGEYYLLTGKIEQAYRNYDTLMKMDSPEAPILKKSLDRTLKQAQNVLKTYRLD